MKVKSRWLIFAIIFLLVLGTFPSVVFAGNSAYEIQGVEQPGNDELPPPPPPNIPAGGPPPPPETDGYTSADLWVNHPIGSCGVVRTEPGIIPDSVILTIEEFAHSPQDSNGVWGLSSLVAINVNMESGGSGSLNSPGAEVCICAAGTGTTPVMASWSPGPNGGTYTPVTTYWRGGSLCTRTTGSDTFGVVDSSYFN